MKQHQYNNICWWCNSPADSREHKYKKSELIDEYGKGPWIKDNQILKASGKGRKDKLIQGPNSKEVKFKKNICKKCNNQTSQPFDQSYDKFKLYLKKYGDRIIKSKLLNFSKVFRKDAEYQTQNLRRYYVKEICCMLADNKVFIHHAILDYLNGSEELPYISIHFQIMKDVVEMRKKGTTCQDNGHFSWGDLSCIKKLPTNEITNIESYYQYRWLRMSWKYDISIEANSDHFSSQIVHLPLNENINSYEYL